MRIILYTGKGGVGKTTISAATAIRVADMGYRTLVISTDPAHSLSDAFDVTINPEPTLLSKNLWAQEINVLEEISKNWGQIQKYLTALFATRGIDTVVAEEMSVLPGMDELISLLQIKRHGQSGKFDCIIVDCAPTADTMRLLSFPDVAEWYMEKLFPWERRIAKTLRPMIQPFMPVPLPTDDVYGAIEALFNQLKGMKGILTDSSSSSMRLVLNPEKMVIKEAQRAFTYLNLYGYHTDLIISNRILPDNIKSSYFSKWKDIQKKYRETIESAFSPLPVLEIPLFDNEVVGVDMLRKMAISLFNNNDPTKIYYRGFVQKIEKDTKGYRLILNLPFIRKTDINLLKKGEDLIVSIGNFRRDIILPKTLARMEINKAKLEDGKLYIHFLE